MEAKEPSLLEWPLALAMCHGELPLCRSTAAVTTSQWEVLEVRAKASVQARKWSNWPVLAKSRRSSISSSVNNDELVAPGIFKSDSGVFKSIKKEILMKQGDILPTLVPHPSSRFANYN